MHSISGNAIMCTQSALSAFRAVAFWQPFFPRQEYFTSLMNAPLPNTMKTKQLAKTMLAVGVTTSQALSRAFWCPLISCLFCLLTVQPRDILCVDKWQKMFSDPLLFLKDLLWALVIFPLVCSTLKAKLQHFCWHFKCKMISFDSQWLNMLHILA